MPNLFFSDTQVSLELEKLWGGNANGSGKVQAPPDFRDNPTTGLEEGMVVLFVDSKNRKATGKAFLRKHEWWIRTDSQVEFRLNSVKVVRVGNALNELGDIRHAEEALPTAPIDRQPNTDTRPEMERLTNPNPSAPELVQVVVPSKRVVVAQASTKPLEVRKSPVVKASKRKPISLTTPDKPLKAKVKSGKTISL